MEAPVLRSAHQVYVAVRGYAQCSTGLKTMLCMQHGHALTQICGLLIP